MDTTRRMWAERIVAEESARVQQIADNWDIYYGNHKKPLAVKTGKPDDNITVNISRLLVDTGVDFLFGKDLLWELTEGEETPAETWLETLWERNRKMTLLQKVATTGGVTGHYYIKIVPDAIRFQGKTYPRLVCLSTENVHKIPEPDDYETVRRYIIEWTSIDPDTDDSISKKQVIEAVRGEGNEEPSSWLLIWYEAKGNDKYVEVDRKKWAYSWPPIVDGANLPNPGEPYGLSDLENADLNDAINSVTSKINRILRYHSSPQTWITGFQGETVEMTADNLLVIPSADGKIGNLEMQSDLDPSRSFLADLIELYHHVSRTPRLDPGKVNIGALSGFALRVLYGPLLSKTTTKQRLYGDALVELMRRLLELGNFGPDQIVTLHWQDPLPTNEKEQAETLKIDRDMEIVSLQTASTKRGYDWQKTERVRLKAEQAEAMTLGEKMALAFQRGIGGEGGRQEEEATEGGE